MSTNRTPNAGHIIRFWGRVEKPENGCWEFAGAKHSAGYGMLRVWNVSLYAHRFVFAALGIAIPDGLHVLHHCDNPPCVRPSHLYFGTQSDNAHDAWSRGRQPKANLTHCPNGHEYTDENTYRTPTGSPACKVCRQRSIDRFYERQGGRKAYRERLAS